MSNKLKNISKRNKLNELKPFADSNGMITCYFCEKTVPLTHKCQRLFDQNVCPECAKGITKLVNGVLNEWDNVENNKEAKDEI